MPSNTQDASYKYLMFAGVAAMAAIAIIVYSLSAGKPDAGGGGEGPAKVPGGSGTVAPPASKWAKRAGQLWGDRRLKPSSSTASPDETACYQNCAGSNGRWAHWFPDTKRCDCFDDEAAGQPYAGCFRLQNGTTWSALDPPKDTCNDNVTLNTCASGGFDTDKGPAAQQGVGTSLGCGISCIGDSRSRAAVWEPDKEQCHCIDWSPGKRCHDAAMKDSQVLWVPRGLLNCDEDEKKGLPACSEPGECSCSSGPGGCVIDDKLTCVGSYEARCGGDCSSCECVMRAPS